ncbi:fumarylacetoacetate hydrolase family protein [Shewanella maritima]|uniref:fumarylacetoacetate hydrolase family protein n=1 Tax=Shewanella maritima TaxID=2520507 RepID=UPI003736C96A
MQHISIITRETHQKNESTPSKIICIGRNYVAHIQELGNEIPTQMVMFVKPNSAISEQLNSRHQQVLHYETELCFSVQNNRLLAVAVGLDLTKRELQSELKRRQLPWERAKAFNGSAVFSPFITLPAEMDATMQTWSFTLEINGQLMQLGHSQLMMYSLKHILDDLAQFMDLEDGDVLMTGTPKGVGVVTKDSWFTVKLWQGLDYESDEQLKLAMKQQQPLLTHSWQAC